MNCLRIVFTAVIFCLMFQCATAQNNYVTHTLKAGESLSTLATEYKTSVGDIMRLNGMHADTKLVYGSQIKIPSTQKQIAVKQVASATDRVIQKPPVPSSNEVTHIVAKGETLYSISKKYNVSVDQLKAWNNITDNGAKLGTLLIISENGNHKFASTETPQKQTTVTIVPEKKTEVVTTTPEKETQVATAPKVNNEPVENNDNPVVNKPPAVKQPETNNVNKTPAAQPQEQANNNNAATTTDVSTYSGEGFFAVQFKQNKNMQNVSGISKTFKTASGWSDGKFYILANDIEPGTIVKLTADNGNAVYAKVLWNMGDMKENAGINFRVSSATAAALHTSNDSFNLNVSF